MQVIDFKDTTVTVSLYIIIQYSINVIIITPWRHYKLYHSLAFLIFRLASYLLYTFQQWLVSQSNLLHAQDKTLQWSKEEDKNLYCLHEKNILASNKICMYQITLLCCSMSNFRWRKPFMLSRQFTANDLVAFYYICQYC